MPVSYVGATSTRSDGSGTYVDIAAHGSEQAGDLVVQVWWLPTTTTGLEPSTSGWTPVLEQDTSSAAPFATWLFWQTSGRQATRWSWSGSTSLFGAVRLIVRGADPDYPFQVGPVLSGAASGQSLALPSMTPLEAGGMAVHFLTARYTSSATGKAIGDVSGYTMSTNAPSLVSAGHTVRMGRRDNVPAGSATGNVSTSATATTAGWGALSVVVREPRPWTPQNKQFHTHA